MIGMELVILGLIVLSLYIFIRLLSTFSAWVSGSRYRAYRHLAAQYRGRYRESRSVGPAHGQLHPQWVDHPGGPGTHHRRTGRPDPADPRRDAIRGGDPVPTRTGPIARPAPPQAPKGTRLVKVGDPAFDRGFLVQANDLEMAVTSSTQRSAPRSATFSEWSMPGESWSRSIPNGSSSRSIETSAKACNSLSAAVREALIIHDGLLGGVMERMNQGIAIVEQPDAGQEDAGPTICKVCGEAILDDAVIVCAACNTPHHRDCWEYVGGCSIYGCSGKVGVTS